MSDKEINATNHKPNVIRTHRELKETGFSRRFKLGLMTNCFCQLERCVSAVVSIPHRNHGEPLARANSGRFPQLISFLQEFNVGSTFTHSS